VPGPTLYPYESPEGDPYTDTDADPCSVIGAYAGDLTTYHPTYVGQATHMVAEAPTSLDVLLNPHTYGGGAEADCAGDSISPPTDGGTGGTGGGTGTGGDCVCPRSAVDLTPLSTLNGGSKFPFGVVSLVSQIFEA